MKIVKVGEPGSEILTRKCIDINLDYFEKVTKALNHMLEFCKDPKNGACGLALPQVGIHHRGFVVSYGDLQEIFINPEITSKDCKVNGDDEKCLSEPGVIKYVVRPKSIVINYINGTGQEIEKKYSGMKARIIQHEINHLDGILLNSNKE